MRNVPHAMPSTVKIMLPFLKPYRFWLGVKLASTLANTANDIFLVYILHILVNASLAGDQAELGTAIQYMILFIVNGAVLNYLETYSAGKFSADAARDMRDRISSHIGKLPISYIDSKHSADTASKMTNGVSAVENFLRDDLMGLVFQTIRLLASISAMLFLNWKLLLVCAAILPIMAALTSLVSSPLNKYSSIYYQSLAASNSAVHNAISGINILKSYNLIHILHNQFKTLLSRLLFDALKVERQQAIMSTVSVIGQFIPFLLFFAVGGYMVLEEQFTAGGLVAFAQLLNYLVPALTVIPRQINNYKIASGAVVHLFEILGEKPEHTGVNRPQISATAAAVSFVDVSFSYSKDKKVLDGVSFSLPQGKMMALVGTSGSGKTTIFKLIAGFYSNQSGCIKLYDEPLSEWDIDYARSHISLVSQETFLYSDTILANITCGKSEFGMEDAIQAAKMANIHDYIQSLPEGYYTHVGERGVRLSGGQKQRLSIARAILKDAPILLLDEATSALDTESEMLVQEAISRIMKDKTVLVVAHRLSTIIEADEVLVLDQGGIVESGTHHELLLKDGAYKKLYNKQLIHQSDSPSIFEMEGA